MIKAGSYLKSPHFRYLLVLSVVLTVVSLWNSPARGQAGNSRSNDSQVLTPGPAERPSVLIDRKTPLAVKSNDRLDIRTKPLRIDVDLVLVPVIVTDTFNHPVTWLGKDDFELMDGSKKQAVQLFSLEDAPMSIALVLDVSNSMLNRIELEREALERFFDNAHPQDEYFAIAVSNDPVMVAGPTQDTRDIQNKLAAIQPAGYTALLDSISLALNKLQSARYGRRAILIISDGGENTSRFSFREVKALAEESDVLIYAIRPVESLPLIRTIEERFGGRLLSGITEATGGRSISLGYNEDIPAAAGAISFELRSQYVLGFRPSFNPRDGKPHKLKVRILKPGNNLHAHYKDQYSMASR